MGPLQVRDREPNVGIKMVEVLVPEEFFHAPKVRTGPNEFCRARAAERVRRDGNGEICLLGHREQLKLRLACEDVPRRKGGKCLYLVSVV